MKNMCIVTIETLSPSMRRSVFLSYVNLS